MNSSQRPGVRLALATALLAPLAFRLAAQVPHGQDRPPGPPLSPEEARARMTVPEGFRVEIFACEPDLVNPVAMNFDERGRIWVVESLEYPRREAGPGRDRVKVIEDTDGDGKADRFTIFAEGLNIPCGVALGNGGVFVTNSPDVLFLADTDGDLKADRREVLFTGFGRSDTHELPNTLTWGPDGWLYGLNGVFNPAVVTHQGKEHRFDAALWRYHPRTRDFELFAQGTSNPWGLAFDARGSAFVSACVIDHLYHLAETGYYHRQAGAYPPFTWKIESVVDHAHQKAAYCGLARYDADVYPERYRDRLYMGNLHGSCINVDRLERRGATYLAQGEPDFLSAHDAWFMPVAVKLGPDGCFYLLDWYDRYHCYQDANRDPKGIDRLKGRLYRIAHGEAPRAGKFDLAAESSAELVARLSHANLWWRSEAQRVLAERLAGGKDAAAVPALKAMVLEEQAPPKTRAHALWTLASAEDPGKSSRFLDEEFQLRVLALGDETLRAWGVRAAASQRQAAGEHVRARIRALARDPDPGVRLQVATASRKLFLDEDALALLLEVLAASEGDVLIPHIVWRNLEPLLEDGAGRFASWFAGQGPAALRAAEPLAGRAIERLLARKRKDLAPLIAFTGAVFKEEKALPGPAAAGLKALAQAAIEGGVAPDAAARLRETLGDAVARIRARGREDELYYPALALAAAWREPAALAEARQVVLDGSAGSEARVRSFAAFLASRDPSVLDVALQLLAEPARCPEELLRDAVLGLGKLEGPRVATALLAGLDRLPPAVRPQAIDSLTARPEWASALLDAVEAKQVDRASLNANQARRILALGDERLRDRVAAVWGQLRLERNPAREEVVEEMKEMIEEEPGDPWAGRAVFEKTCAQCHVLFGRGNAVGPDITVNGRETVDALLSNLLDPNLVIGKGYEGWTLLTKDGRALSGLLVEDSDSRAVVKVAGGKDEVVQRGEVESLTMSAVSLMPEDLEKTLKENEFRDLIAFLRYEEAPPAPIEVARQATVAPERRRIAVEQSYGEVCVEARFPEGGATNGSGDLLELLCYVHSNDGRPFAHPVRAPGRRAVLTALNPEDHPWQYGLFTGHARVNGVDFWHEKGWIRSRGLESLRELDDRIEIVSTSDWLTARRGGQRLLVERQRLTVHAPDAADRYRVDFTWELTPDEEVTFDRYDYGGLAFRPADHDDRRHERASGGEGRAWQDVSGRFRDGGGRSERLIAGAAILDHPSNPGYPNAWRVDDQGLINPAITARGPLVLPAGKTAVFRYRIIVHRGHGEKEMLDAEHRAWAEADKPR